MPKPLIFNLEGDAKAKFADLMAVVQGNKDALDAYRASVLETNPSIAAQSDEVLRVKAAMEANSIANQNLVSTQAALSASSSETKSAIAMVASEESKMARGAEEAEKAFQKAKENSAKIAQQELKEIIAGNRLMAQLEKQQAMESAQNRTLQVRALMALRGGTKLTVDQIKAMSNEELKATIAARELELATNEFNRANSNVIPGLERGSQWMQKNHLTAGHYAAMIDRLSGTHSGLATVLRSAFDPALLGVGVTLALVSAAVHAYQKSGEEAEKFMKDNTESSHKLADAYERLEKAGIKLDAVEKLFIKSNKELDLKPAKEQLDKLNKEFSTHYVHVTNSIQASLLWAQTLDSLGITTGKYAKTIAEVAPRLRELNSEQNSVIAQGVELSKGYRISAEEMGHWASRHEELVAAGRSAGEKLKAEYDDEMDRLKKDHESLLISDAAWNQARIDLEQDYATRLGQLQDKELDEHNARMKAQASSAKRMRDEWASQLRAYALDHADAYQKVQIETEEHVRKLRELMLTQPKHRKEILDMIFGYELDAQKKIIKLHEEEAKRISQIESSMFRDYKREQDKELSEAVSHSIKKVQLYKKETDAKRHLEMQVAKDIQGLAEATGNKQIQKVGQVVGFVEKMYKTWKDIESLMAAFRVVKEAETARVAIQTNTTQASSAAAQQSALAGVNAFASAAAIPYVGWMIAPGAMAEAEAMTAPMSGVISALGAAAQGAIQAHKGLSVPADGSYIASLQKGEVIIPNTSSFTDVSTAMTQIAEAGKSRGEGGTTIQVNFNGGVIGQRQVEMAVGKAAMKARKYGVHS